MTDPVSDFLTRLRNAQQSRLREVKVPYSRLKLEMIKVLHLEGYVTAYKLHSDETEKKWIEVGIRYLGKQKPLIRELKRISRPGLRVYVGHDEIPMTRNGMGIVILSTSKGILTDRQAREAKVGGELLCSVW